MKKILKLIFIISTISIIYFSFIYLYSPYIIPSSDIYQFSASIYEMSHQNFIDIGDPYFIDTIKDPHYGPYLASLSIIKVVSGVNPKFVLLFFGFFNFILLTFSLYFFVNHFTKNKKLALIFSLTFFLLWGYSRPIFTGLLSITDLTFTSSYPTVFGLAFFFFLLPIFDRYIVDNNSNKKFFFLLLFLSSVLFLSHIVSGIIFFSQLYILCIYRYKYLKKDIKKTMLILTFPIIVLLVSVVWPLYNPISIFQEYQTVNTGEFNLQTDFYFYLSNWLIIAGPFFILGLIQITKKENKFFLISILFLFILSISYIFPIRISMFWRFWPLLIIFSNILFISLILGFSNKKYQIFILFLVVILGLLFIQQKFMIVNQNNDFSKKYNELPIFDDNKYTILSDPLTSYHLAGLYGYRVFSVPLNHLNPLNEKEAYQRYYDNYNFMIIGNTTINEITKKYRKENFILIINKNYIGDGILFKNNIIRNNLTDELVSYNYTITSSNNFIIAKLDK